MGHCEGSISLYVYELNAIKVNRMSGIGTYSGNSPQVSVLWFCPYSLPTTSVKFFIARFLY